MNYQLEYVLSQEGDLIIGLPSELAKNKTISAFYHDGSVCLVIGESGILLDFLPAPYLSILKSKGYFFISSLIDDQQLMFESVKIKERYEV
ncbi:hypothetical protein [Vibrio parahaemolyticus]|uniref:hypothetical protein n=1 Tax=Vibrio parahaemolyticus TaxID=670 RepID=UPI001E302D8E|nr:hypothetical protein [Vibrio parahaemolyticus]